MVKKKKRGKRQVKCNICGQKFKSERGLKIHKSSKHKNSNWGGKEEVKVQDLRDEKDIAEDFGTKVYQKFDKIIKSVVLFGSQAKNTSIGTSDIDIIIIIDDASIKWDQELVAWYREELGKIIRANPYHRDLHVNTVKLTTWWKDLMRGDPVVYNMLRFGQAMIDFGGFFNPLKVLLEKGSIKSTPEAIYNCLERIPGHIARSKMSEASSVEGVYWAMVEGAQAALMAAGRTPPSPEHIPKMLKETFVDTKNLNMKYVKMFRHIYTLHRKISHGEINNIEGDKIDQWQDNAEKFVQKMNKLVNDLTEK